MLLQDFMAEFYSFCKKYEKAFRHKMAVSLRKTDFVEKALNFV